MFSNMGECNNNDNNTFASTVAKSTRMFEMNIEYKLKYLFDASKPIILTKLWPDITIPDEVLACTRKKNYNIQMRGHRYQPPGASESDRGRKSSESINARHTTHGKGQTICGNFSALQK